MAVTIAKIRVARASNAAAADALTLEDGRLVFDGVRVRVHNNATAGGLKCLMEGEGGAVVRFEALSRTATGSVTVAMGSTTSMNTTELTLGAGAGAYVYNVLLPETYSGSALVAGSRCLLIVRFPSADAYHVDVYMTATSNPRLMRLSSTGGMASASCEFIWTGTAWVAAVPAFSAAG